MLHEILIVTLYANASSRIISHSVYSSKCTLNVKINFVLRLAAKKHTQLFAHRPLTPQNQFSCKCIMWTIQANGMALCVCGMVGCTNIDRCICLGDGWWPFNRDINCNVYAMCVYMRMRSQAATWRTIQRIKLVPKIQSKWDLDHQNVASEEYKSNFDGNAHLHLPFAIRTFEFVSLFVRSFVCLLLIVILWLFLGCCPNRLCGPTIRTVCAARTRMAMH